MSTEFKNLPLKTSISKESGCNMMTFKELNDKNVSFSSPLDVFSNFYINVGLLDRIRQSINEFRVELDAMSLMRPDKESIDNTYLEKKDANYQKSILLTEERLKSLLEKYCNKMKIDIDIENCKTHSRSTATSLANYLGIIVATSKQAVTNNGLMYEDAINNRDQLASISEAIGNIGEQG